MWGKYKSPTQKIRILTEDYVLRNSYCPSCGGVIKDYENNRRCADFYCENCSEDYELKSKCNGFGNKIADGDYNTMIRKINSETPSNFFFLNYVGNEVSNFFTIPKFFFVESIIEKRKPLSESAVRAGWVGCNILYNQLPSSAKIFYVKDGVVLSERSVIDNYKKVVFVGDKGLKGKGWLLDVMCCVEDLIKKKNENLDYVNGYGFFSLDEIYKYEKVLWKKHSDNDNVKPKIRQQLQFLRDKGYVEFVGRGRYRLVKNG